ncbi:MAG: arylsulfatase [Gemmatimonadales bacterium]|nr:arylsulfatase [Gemmatimonadales bacterium]MBA3553153.1 arylsulfatase [Gemmatimonadales bacterium]
MEGAVAPSRQGEIQPWAPTASYLSGRASRCRAKRVGRGFPPVRASTILEGSVSHSGAAVPFLLVAALCAAAASATAQTAAEPAPPNILLIQADDLGYGDLSAYGQARFQTPALDRLAREGIRFTQYYAGSPVCAPSRAALMTGFHSGHGWIRGHGDVPLRPQDTTIAEVLHAEGYRTAVIGKWGLGGPGSTGAPERKGFEYSFGFLDHNHAHRQYTDHLWRNGERVETDPNRDYVNDLFTREAVGFIEQGDPRPYFLYLNYTVPHAELRAPDESVLPFRGRFPEVPYSNPAADERTSGSDEASLGHRSQATPHAAFAGMVTRMDRDIGRLLELLESRDMERRTLVLFVSDNGPHQAGGGDPVFFRSTGGLRGRKGEVYEGGIRVPMIARWTGRIPAGQVSDHVWAHWDMLPTLADLAGAEAPSGLDGVSMWPALRGEAQPAQPFLYWELGGRRFQQAVRMGAWKAVRVGSSNPLELYDLRSDPAEQHDVAASQPEVVSRIDSYLRTARTDSRLWPMPSAWQAWARRAPRIALALVAISGLAWIGMVGRRAFRRRERAPQP